MPYSHRRDDWVFIAAGLLVFALGLAGALFFGLTAFLDDRPNWTAASAFVAVMVALSAMGGVLALAGWRGGMRSALAVRPRWLAALAALYPVSLIAGQASLALDFAPQAILPAAHLAASLLPVALLAGYSLRRIGRFSSRRVLAHFAAGIWGTAIPAFLIEGAVVVAIAVIVAVGVGLGPDGFVRLRALVEQLQAPSFLAAPEDQLRLILQPGVLAGAAFLAVITAPLAEESFKALGVPLSAWLGAELSPASGFLGGLLGGAAYGLLENMLAVDVGEGSFWAGTVVVRLAPLTMHAFTGALVGWGWAQALRMRRPGRLAFAYGAALFIHASWNFSAVALVYAAAQVMVNPGNLAVAALAGLGLAVCGLYLVGLTIACAVGLAVGIARVR